MKKRVGLLAILPIIALFINLLPLQVTAAETDPVLDRVQANKELVVGLSADYAPFEFHATVKGKDTIVGFDVAIAEKIAEDLGVKLKVEELGFDALLGALQTGKVDMVISGMNPTPEREKEVNFTDGYMTVTQKVVVRKADEDKFSSLEKLNGATVGVQKQSYQEELAASELPDSDVTSLQKVPDLITNLTNEKIDGVILEGPVADAYAQVNKSLAVADNVVFKEGSKEMAAAVSKEAPAFLAAVNASIADIRSQDLLTGYQKEANDLMFAEEEQSFLGKYLPYYLSGAGYTVFLAFIGVLFGAVFGGLLALMKLAKNKFLKVIATVYIEYVRGTPLLVQIFIVYFGTGVLGFDMSKLAAGCIALALNSAAYVAEIIRAGINAVNKGQVEAARSLGMSQGQSMRFIILPQAVKNIFPP